MADVMIIKNEIKDVLFLFLSLHPQYINIIIWIYLFKEQKK